MMSEKMRYITKSHASLIFGCKSATPSGVRSEQHAKPLWIQRQEQIKEQQPRMQLRKRAAEFSKDLVQDKFTAHNVLEKHCKFD